MAPAHLQHHEVKRAEPLADRLIFRREACIAAEEDGVPLRADRERRPQGRVAIVQAAPEKCCEGAAVTVSPVFGSSAIPTSRARRCALA